MKKRIKNLIRNNPILYIIIQVIRNRKKSEYINTIMNAKDGNDVIRIIPKANSISRQPFCFVEAGQTNGLCASIRTILNGLYFCDEMGIIPYVRLVDSKYYDKNMPKDLNPFEYYYVQPTTYTESELISKHPQVIYCPGRVNMVDRITEGRGSYFVNEEYVYKMADIIQRLLKYNSSTQKNIREFLKQTEIDDNVLGVHIRGTDYKQNFANHPTYITPDEYYVYVDEAINLYGFNTIFLATDDKDILNEFVQHYGSEKVCYNRDAVRTKGNKSIIEDKTDDEKVSRYKLGMDVICDMMGLSNCGGIVCGESQVSTLARIYKRSLGGQYKHEKVLSNGLNKRGKKIEGYKY